MARNRTQPHRDQHHKPKALTVEQQRANLEAVIAQHQPEFTPMGIDLRELLLELAKAMRELDPLDSGDAGQTPTIPRDVVK